MICWGLDTNTHHMMTFSTSHLGQNIYHGCLTHLKSCAGSAQSRLANDANDAVEADFQSSDLNFMNLPFRVACDLRKISLKSLHGFNLSAVFLLSQAPTTRMTRNRTFLKRAMPPCRALPALPLPRLSRSSQCIARSFVLITVLLCLPFSMVSMKQNTETKTSENQRLFWAVHCGCGTCLYSRDKSTNSRSCFGLKP